MIRHCFYATLLLASTTLAQNPIPRQGNSCPTGTYRSGDYCKPVKSSEGEVIIQKSGSKCPTGLYTSGGNYCKRISSSDRGADVGYNRVIIAVKSVEETSQKATTAGGVVTALPYGDQTSHAVIKDPDGVLLELVEAPELVPGARPARIIGLGMTTNDIDTTIKDMCDGFGFTPCEDVFQQKTYWQGNGRLEQDQTLQLDDMYLLVSQYRDSRPRRADYQLSDIGIMNFAVCFPDQADFQSCYQLTQQMGMRTNSEPLIIGNDASVAYNNDRQGFSVEMIFMASKLWGLYGFTPPRVLDRVINKFLEWKAQRSHKKRLSINTK